MEQVHHGLVRKDARNVVEVEDLMEQLQRQYVLDKLKKGVDVTCVDFKKNRIMSCMDMTMRVLMSVVEDPMCLFFVDSAA